MTDSNDAPAPDAPSGDIPDGAELSTSGLLDPGALVRALRNRAKKSFGQHFLTDVGVLDRIVRAAHVGEGDRVVEVGPGPGGLTVRLLASGASVSCLEADPWMVEHLEDELGGRPGFDVTHGDATTEALDNLLGDPPATVVSNLPYNAATPILFRLLDNPTPPQRMVLMFQLEVAQRVACGGADRLFGPLGLAANLLYETRLAFQLKPGAFTPPPKVVSGVVTFELRDTLIADHAERAAARQVARGAFSQRRKMLRKSLLSVSSDPVALCEAAGVPPTARPEALTCAEFVALGRAWDAAGRQ